MNKQKKTSSFAKKKPASKLVVPKELIKLDIGCGPNKQPGFLGMDITQYDGKVDIIHDIRKTPWPLKTASVGEVHCSHVLEHLTNLDGKWERVRFFNELYRIMAPGAKMTLIFPHWASQRFYGDPTHKEPFSEFGFYYLSREWRLGGNAPHADAKYVKGMYDCNFECTWGYNIRQDVMSWNTERQTYAAQNYKEVINDIVATCVRA